MFNRSQKIHRVTKYDKLSTQLTHLTQEFQQSDFAANRDLPTVNETELGFDCQRSECLMITDEINRRKKIRTREVLAMRKRRQPLQDGRTRKQIAFFGMNKSKRHSANQVPTTSDFLSTCTS